MAQAFQVADRIVVIRQGMVAGDVATADTTSPDEIVRHDHRRGVQPRRQQPGRRLMSRQISGSEQQGEPT